MKYTPMLMEFQRMLNIALIRDKFTFKLGKRNKFFSYMYRKPFIPLVFHNGHSLRYVVSPKREWIDPICSVCVAGKKEIPMKDGLSIAEFAKDFNHKFGIQQAKTAIRMILYHNGFNVFPKRVKQAMEYVERYMENKLFNLEELAAFYNFKNEKTRLDKKIPEPQSS